MANREDDFYELLENIDTGIYVCAFVLVIIMVLLFGILVKM